MFLRLKFGSMTKYMILNKRKIFSFFTAFFLIFCFSYAKDLSVMSFNIQGHGPGSMEHRMGKVDWENQIVSIIRESQAQIVLLQEVPLSDGSNNLAKAFAEKLNKGKSDWNFTTSVEYSVSSMDLNNAVLYNQKYVTLKNDYAKKSPFNMYSYKQNPEEDNRKFKFAKNNEQILEFIFNQHPEISFMVVNVHLPGPDEAEKIFEERRQLELLYALYKRKMPIIIAGDFNMKRRDLIRGSNFSDAVIDGDNGIYSDVWGQKTTVTNDIANFSLSNDFDHFIISKNNFFTISEQMHLVFFKGKQESIKNLKIGNFTYADSYTYFKGQNDIPSISDHLPIMIKLKFLK